MTIFEDIRRQRDTLRAQGKKIEEILVDDKWIARGFSFMVENGEKYYYLVNSYDLELACSSLPSVVVGDLSNSIFGIPVTYSRERAEKFVKGIYVWAYKSQSRIQSLQSQSSGE